MAGLVDRFHRMLNPPEDEYEDYYEDEPEGEEEEDSGSGRDWDRFDGSRRSVSFSDYTSRRSTGSGGRVLNINAKAQFQVVMFRPVSFKEDAWVIADELLQRHMVVLNLEDTDEREAEHILYFISGVAYANNGKFRPITKQTVIVVPYNVDLTGNDVMDELENSGIFF